MVFLCPNVVACSGYLTLNCIKRSLFVGLNVVACSGILDFELQQIVHKLKLQRFKLTSKFILHVRVFILYMLYFIF